MHALELIPRRSRGLLIPAMVALAASVVSAQDEDAIVVDSVAEAAANAPATIRDVDDARTSTLVLDEFINRTLDRTVARTQRPLTLSGNISTRYTYIQGKQPTPVFHGFNTPNITLGFRGTLYRDYQEAKNLTYALGFSSSNGAAPTVQDANIAYALLSTVDLKSPSLNVTIGQQKKPWGQEAQADAEVQPSITGSTYLGGSVNVGDVSARDIGIVVRGDILPAVDYGYNYRAPLLSVGAGLFNGAGPNVARDNNRDKEWVVRAVLAPPVDYYNFLRGLTVGASFAKAEKTIIATGAVKTPASTITVKGTGKDSAKTGTITTAAVAGPADTIEGDRTRLGLDVSYIRTPVNFTVEAVYATQDSVYYDKVDKAYKPYHLQSWGASATLFLNFGEQFLRGYREQARPDDWWPVTYQPFFRVDGFDPNHNISGGDVAQGSLGAWQIVGTIGGNLFFARTTKLQVNYRWKKTEDKPANFHETLVQLAYGF